MISFKHYQIEANAVGQFRLNQYRPGVDWEYQKGAKDRLGQAAMGLAGEVGEVLEPLKKAIYHGHELDVNEIKKELGDALWYLNDIASCLGISMEEVAQANLDKLRDRYPNGFTKEASQNRKENQ